MVVVDGAEWRACALSLGYFLDRYGWVYDATGREWIRFGLWPAQRQVARVLAERRLVVILKARQLGLSWLVVGSALWLMLFRPAATVLFFSKRDDEAVHLLSFRLRGMYDRLPGWMRRSRVVTANAHELRLSSGSAALAFPTTGGRSYTASLAVVDEADHVPDLDGLLNAVKPTIDAGGRLVLVSTVDKSNPSSAFKRIYRAGVAGENGYAPIFLGWSSRPGRDAAWYADQMRDVRARTGALDDLYQEYPGTDLEALAARSMDRRLAAEWLTRCSEVRDYGPALSGGEVRFVGPAPGAEYVIGADPAEGNPQSDESAACVLDVASGEQVAVLGGRYDPGVFGARLVELSEAYNGAAVLVERNNHGHAVLLWLREFSGVYCLPGLDGKPGWLTTGRGKAVAYDQAASILAVGGSVVHDRMTLEQLAAIEGSSLNGAGDQADDRAMAFVLALAAVRWGGSGSGESAVIAPVDVVEEADGAEW